jgi:KipI family sensor histidine kinase inhibitor
MRVLRYGERAVLAEVDDARLVPAMRAALATRAGVVDAVAGACTVLVVFDPAVTSAETITALIMSGPDADAPAAAPPSSVQLPVRYDGDDLAEVAAEVGLSVDEIIARHCAAEYTVRFCGFSPGFAYLDGLDPRLHVPRRSSPRTAVPAGSVAVAGEFTGVYPRSSPGGWRLLGRTDATLWDVARDPPALLAPGTRVRFERA